MLFSKSLLWFGENSLRPVYGNLPLYDWCFEKRARIEPKIATKLTSHKAAPHKRYDQFTWSTDSRNKNTRSITSKARPINPMKAVQCIKPLLDVFPWPAMS